MSRSYGNAVSVTSQVFFCAAPIRIDAYDGCQFGCTYCFSRKRSRLWADRGTHSANAEAFRKRLERVAQGRCASALDDFLKTRTPIQLGGLHDPFTPREAENGVTLALLQTLRDHDYPTLISTKGSILIEPEYLEVLKGMNVVVRFSAAGVSELARPEIDRKCDPFDYTLTKIETLAKAGIPTALRIQPLFPGFEIRALEMTTEAAAAGVRQVSFEYLKIPNELSEQELARMAAALGYDIKERYRSLGAHYVGRDRVLNTDVKKPFVKKARGHCHDLGLRFGAGDTEFIPWSDGKGCCGSSDLLLREAQQFETNFTGIIKAALLTDTAMVRADKLKQVWSPSHAVSPYLASRSRNAKHEGEGLSDWMQLVLARWNGKAGPYCPSFFEGVEDTGELDDDGFKIYSAMALKESLTARTSDL